MRARHLFVYGSLCAPAVFAAVTGRWRVPRRAWLPGHRAVRVPGAVYPMLSASHVPDGHAEGRVYLHVNAAALRRLDAFEGAWYRRVPVRVRVEGRDAPLRAQVYAMRPGGRSRLRARRDGALIDWSLDDFLRLHARTFARYWRDRLRRAQRG